MASPALYTILGFVTGPVGGAISGYLYAAKENEIAEIQGRRPEKSEFISAAIGFFFANLGGAYYGYNLAKTQNKLDAIKWESPYNQLAPYTPSVTDRAVNTPERTVAPSQWQNKILAEREAQHSQAATR